MIHEIAPAGAVIHVGSALPRATPGLDLWASKPERALAEMESRTRESEHRIKNHLQLVASMLSMQARSSGDPVVADALRGAAGRVVAVARVHARLQEATVDCIDAGQFIRELCADLADALDLTARSVSISATCDPVLLDGVQAAPLALIVNELVTNSIKHAYRASGGEVAVELRHEAGARRLSVSDRGPGLPEESSVPEKLGMTLVRKFARQLGGSMFIERPGRGAVVGVRF